MKDNNQELSDNLITDFNSPAAEAMQTFQVNLSLSDFRHPAQVIGVTSAIQGEGKSTFSVNLANTYAFRGAKTVLVNFDIRKPVVHLLYNVKNDVGLTEYVAGDCTLDEIIKTTPQGVDLVNPGTPTPYPTRILDSAKIKDLISELRKRYQFIIVDLPPVWLLRMPFWFPSILMDMWLLPPRNFPRRRMSKRPVRFFRVAMPMLRHRNDRVRISETNTSWMLTSLLFSEKKRA
ncbi:MAG: CpsD/CapB family tyrosine-protein kinase [Bacilli bacterium]|jgi:hypothetical protein|nr:CpsD/CapB family tyrosine-protein kinase [Bacilli bacterium]